MTSPHTHHICKLQRYFEAATKVETIPPKKTVIILTSVAAQVHAETMPAAMRPGLMLREALLNSSEF